MYVGKDYQVEMVKVNKGLVWFVNVIFSLFIFLKSYEFVLFVKSFLNILFLGN